MEVVRESMELQEVSANSRDVDGFSSLILASGAGRVRVVQELLKHRRVIINVKDNAGRTALTWTNDGGHEQFVDELGWM